MSTIVVGTLRVPPAYGTRSVPAPLPPPKFMTSSRLRARSGPARTSGILGHMSTTAIITANDLLALPTGMGKRYALVNGSAARNASM